MKRARALLFAVVFSAALLVGVSPASASAGGSGQGPFPCGGWTITGPLAYLATVAASASDTCVTRIDAYGWNFGGIIGIVKIWDYESDGHYHLLGVGSAAGVCQTFKAYGTTITTCTVNPSAHTAVFPPHGNYHAEFEVVGSYTSQCPGCELLDDANSGGVNF